MITATSSKTDQSFNTFGLWSIDRLKPEPNIKVGLTFIISESLVLISKAKVFSISQYLEHSDQFYHW